MMKNETIISMKQDLEPFCKKCSFIDPQKDVLYVDEAPYQVTITCKRINACRRVYELGKVGGGDDLHGRYPG